MCTCMRNLTNFPNIRQKHFCSTKYVIFVKIKEKTLEHPNFLYEAIFPFFFILKSGKIEQK